MRFHELQGKTKKELLDLARKHSIQGRSGMSREDLIQALGRVSARQAAPRREGPRRGASDERHSRKSQRGDSRRDSRGRRSADSDRRPGGSSTPLPRVDAIRTQPRDRRPGPSGRPDAGRHDRAGRTDRRSRFDRRDRRDQPKRRDDRRPAADRYGAVPTRRGGPEDERVLQAREHLRRSGEQRRQGAVDRPFGRDRGGRPAAETRPSTQRPQQDRPQQGADRPRQDPQPRGADRLVLMVRDPYWLHAYWEISPQTLERARDQLGRRWEGHRWILRVQSLETDADRADTPQFDIDLNPQARNWYLRVPRPDRQYQGTIGILARDGTFHPMARSAPVRTPPGRETEAGPQSTPAIDAAPGSEQRPAPLPETEQELRLRVETELVVYGSTAPEARLTIQGIPVPVRQDGTFSQRLLLPDGSQAIECVATSADGARSARTATMIRKETAADAADGRASRPAEE